MQSSPSLLTHFEINSFIQSLDSAPSLSLLNVASRDWIVTTSRIEKLNIQAHQEADSTARHDEYVIDRLTTYNKLNALVRRLLLCEAFREKVYPSLHQHPSLQSHTIAPLKLYLLLHSESTLVNLLELALFHESCLTALSDEECEELMEYCCRRVRQLHDRKKFTAILEPDNNNVNNSDSTLLQLSFNTASCCLSILRFFTDSLYKLSLAHARRLVVDNDILMLVAPLLQYSPFERLITQDGKRQLQKFVDMKWQTVSRDDADLLTKLSAQMWLIVLNCTCSQLPQSLYRFDTQRQTALLSLRRHLTETLLDQFPLLTKLRRYLEELSMMDVSAVSGGMLFGNQQETRTKTIIEQMSEIKQEIWAQVESPSKVEGLIEKLVEAFLSSDRSDLELLSDTFNIDNYPVSSLPETIVCGLPSCEVAAIQRCSRCKSEWYCSRQCQVKDWKRHKKECRQVEKKENKKVTQETSVDDKTSDALPNRQTKKVFIEIVNEQQNDAEIVSSDAIPVNKIFPQQQLHLQSQESVAVSSISSYDDID